MVTKSYLLTFEFEFNLCINEGCWCCMRETCNLFETVYAVIFAVIIQREKNI